MGNHDHEAVYEMITFTLPYKMHAACMDSNNMKQISPSYKDNMLLTQNQTDQTPPLDHLWFLEIWYS